MFLSSIVALLFLPSVQALPPTQPVQCYSYKKDSTHVEWVGYKYTEKAAVKGRLPSIETKISGTPQSIDDLILATSFEVDALSVESGDPARDANLRDHFFKLMTSTKITGKIVSLASNIARVELKMNGVTKPVEFKVAKNGSNISAVATVDILNFSMSPSLKKINEVCSELHKGKDGVSKTWSTVELNISAEVVELCKKGVK
jgi:polyisoprenoid-binding protein YceI